MTCHVRLLDRGHEALEQHEAMGVLYVLHGQKSRKPVVSCWGRAAAPRVPTNAVGRRRERVRSCGVTWIKSRLWFHRPPPSPTPSQAPAARLPYRMELVRIRDV